MSGCPTCGYGPPYIHLSEDRHIAHLEADNARLTAERDRERAARIMAEKGLTTLSDQVDEAEAERDRLERVVEVRTADVQFVQAERDRLRAALRYIGEGQPDLHSPLAEYARAALAQPSDAGTYRWDDPHADPDAERAE